jgi:hypothetical protein
MARADRAEDGHQAQGSSAIAVSTGDVPAWR